jgi:hypothetical protein
LRKEREVRKTMCSIVFGIHIIYRRRWTTSQIFSLQSVDCKLKI